MVGDGGSAVCIGNKLFNSESIDVVWLRRHTNINMPSWVAPDDIRFIRQESNAFFRWIWGGALNNARWIQSLGAHLTVGSKILQMQAAQQVGFQIPLTLFSNDPKKIREFVEVSELNGGAVYKTFFPMAWDEPDVVRPVLTTPVCIADFKDDELIRAVPGIYQRRIEKKYEIRATFFGNRDISVKIDSQSANKGEVDWRDISDISSHLSVVILPDEIRERCLRYMDQIGMDMACIDLIVSSEGDYYFLEANPQGQFLWIEQDIPEAEMLREVCSFLVSPSRNRVSENYEKFANVSMARYLKHPLIDAMKEELGSSGFIDTNDFFKGDAFAQQ